jgi:hypothetical protein
MSWEGEEERKLYIVTGGLMVGMHGPKCKYTDYNNNLDFMLCYPFLIKTSSFISF